MNIIMCGSSIGRFYLYSSVSESLNGSVKNRKVDKILKRSVENREKK